MPIKHMCQDVTTSGKCVNVLSELFQVDKLVDYDDILSPILFIIFINDIMGHLNDDNSSSPNLINETIDGIFYVDDIIILSTSPLGLQNSPNTVGTHCNTLKFKINQTKSNVMCFSKNGKESPEKFVLQMVIY